MAPSSPRGHGGGKHKPKSPRQAAQTRPMTGRAYEVNRQASQSIFDDPEAIQAGLYLLLSLLASYVLFRLLRMLLWSLPLIAIGLYFTKPDLGKFEDALRLLDKKNDGSAADVVSSSSSSSHVSGSGSGWLMNLVSRTIERTSSLLHQNPLRDWYYLDLGILVLARKIDRSGTSSVSPVVLPHDGMTFSIGIAYHWLMFNPANVREEARRRADGGRPWLLYVQYATTFLASLVPEDSWQAFSALASKRRKEERERQRAAVDNGVDALLSAAANAAASSVAGVLNNISDEDIMDEYYANVSSSPRGGRRAGGGNSPRSGGSSTGEKPIREHMNRAQALAEKGRFLEAGYAVEQGLAKCRHSLKNGMEEETELLLVAAAFYEAAASSSSSSSTGAPGLTSRLKCLQQAAILCVKQERWAKAAELFEECASGWHEEKEKGSHYALLATDKAAPLVLSAVLAQLQFGDAVKAEQVYRYACLHDDRCKVTAEGELVAAVLAALHAHESQAIIEAKARCMGRLLHHQDRQLQPWQEKVLKSLCKRIDAGQLR